MRLMIGVTFLVNFRNFNVLFKKKKKKNQKTEGANGIKEKQNKLGKLV